MNKGGEGRERDGIFAADFFLLSKVESILIKILRAPIRHAKKQE